MPEKAVDSRAITGFWNLSCSPVGAEVFPNKKQESDFSTMLDCLYFFGVFARHLCLFLEMKGKSVLRLSLLIFSLTVSAPPPPPFFFFSFSFLHPL